MPVNIGDEVLQGKEGRFGLARCVEIGTPVPPSRSKPIKVIFKNTKSERWCRQSQFLVGEVKDYYFPVVRNRGYLGRLGEMGVAKGLRSYSYWSSMLDRSCDKGRSYSDKNMKFYSDVSCSDYFANFSNFNDWFESQENLEDLLDFCDKFGWRLSLDKDILVKGNKTYSETTCCLVPENLNYLMIFRDINKKTTNLPRGVHNSSRGVEIYVDRGGIFDCDSDTSRYFKYFSFDKCNEINCYEDITVALEFYNYFGYDYKECELAAIGAAFREYKRVKEEYIKKVAETMHNWEIDGRLYRLITDKCFESLMKWEIHITD